MSGAPSLRRRAPTRKVTPLANSDSPLMQQYREVKERYPHMLVLFRVGDFFELFGDDAETAARTLDMALTSRDQATPMAGFPHTALDAYVRRLVQAGHCVAVCDQVEDPAAASGLVRRDVVRVFTPGTITEEELLDPLRPNHLAAIFPHGEQLGLAWVEPSTGAFHAADVCWERIAD